MTQASKVQISDHVAAELVTKEKAPVRYSEWYDFDMPGLCDAPVLVGCECGEQLAIGRKEDGTSEIATCENCGRQYWAEFTIHQRRRLTRAEIEDAGANQ